MDELQKFYDQAPYHILYYDNELDAYRTDKFAGWTNQPLDGGYPLFSYSVIDYQYLTDASSGAHPGAIECSACAPSGSGVSRRTPGPRRRHAVVGERRRIGGRFVVEHDAAAGRWRARRGRCRGFGR